MEVPGNKTRWLMACALAAPLSVPIATGAAAQDIPAPKAIVPAADPAADKTVPETPVQDDAADRTTDIIVTAQRYSQSVQTVPSAITALSGKDIASRGITSLSDLQFAAPSLGVGTQNGVSNVSIRGVGLNVRQGAPGVGIYVDDVYQPNPNLGSLTQIDLARVEVLRGPQGTLYGRNTTGGAVSFFSAAPTDRFEGYVLGGVSSYHQNRLQGVVNVPLGAGWALRVTGDRSDRNRGFVKNVVPGSPDVDYGTLWSARARLGGNIGENLAISLAYTRQITDGPFDYNTISNPPNAAALVPAPILATAISATAPLRTSVNTPSDTHRDFKIYAGTAVLTLPFGQLKTVTSFQKFDDRSSFDGDGTSAPFTVGAYSHDYKTFIQEAILSVSAGDFQGTLGTFYMRDSRVEGNDFSFPTGYGPLPPTAILSIRQTRYTTKAYAGYADGTLGLTPAFRLIAGARYSVDKQRIATGTTVNFPTPGGLLPIVVLCPPYEANLEFSAFTPRVGAQYDFSGTSTAYGTISRGYKSGGANAAGCPNFYKPEKVTSFEIGSKNRFFDRKLLLNISAFAYDYKDLQVDQLVGLAVQITNAASAKVKGVELETVYTPSKWLTLNNSVTFLDAKYDSFTNTDAVNRQLGPQDLSGNRLSFSPRWSINSGVMLDTGPASWGSAQLRADVSYRSQTYFREFNAPLDGQSKYATVNLNLTVSPPSDLFQLRLFATNLTNKGYVTTLTASEAIGARSRIWNQPRQIGAEVRVNF